MKKLSFLLGVLVVLALAFASAADCPYGVINDPYPGQCTLYIDKNTDGFCDHSETELEETGQIVEHKEGAEHECTGQHKGRGEHKEHSIEERNLREGQSSQQTLRAYFAMFHFEYLGIVLLFTIVMFWLNKKSSKTVKWINMVLIYILLPLFAIAWPIYLGYIQNSGREVFEFGRHIGYACLRLLFLILYAKPLCIGRKKPNKKEAKVVDDKGGNTIKKYFAFVVSQRRALGIAVFYLALGHALVYLAFRYNQTLALNKFFNPQYFIIGVVGFVALFIGRITSNNRSIKKFKKRRKPLQMTAYLALFGAVIHIFLINTQAGLMLTGLTICYAMLKILERRKR